MARWGEVWKTAGGLPEDMVPAVSNLVLRRASEPKQQSGCFQVLGCFYRGVVCGQVREGEELGAVPHKREQIGEWDGKCLTAS